MSLESWEKQGQKEITSSSEQKTKRILAAAKAGERLHIRYSKPNGIDERTITPKRVFSKLGEPENYVEAYCHKKNAQRVFMIKRITILNEGSSQTVSTKKVVTVSSSRRIPCSVDYVELEGDYGPVDSVEVTCSRCGHTTESYGDGADSIRRCLALLKEECPKGESNWYVEE
jgi:hypothetical protein